MVLYLQICLILLVAHFELQIVFHIFEFLTTEYWYFCTRINSCIVLYRTRHSFQEYSNKGAFCNRIALTTSNNFKCWFDFFTVKRLIHIVISVKYFVILKTLHEVSSVCIVSRRRFFVSQRRFFVSLKIGDSADNSC